MLSANADSGSAPKRKLANTYGKNRTRNGLSGAEEAAASSKPAANKPLLSRSKLKTDDRPGRPSTMTTPAAAQDPDPYDFPDDAGTPPARSLSSRAPPKPTQTAASSATGPRPTMKRKPTHPPGTRQPKKQRSSSPDVLPDLQHTPKPQTSNSQSGTVATKTAGKPSERPLPSDDPIGRSAIRKPGTGHDQERSIPIRPPRKTNKAPPKNTGNGKSDLFALEVPDPESPVVARERVSRRNSPDKNTGTLAKQDTASRETELQHKISTKPSRPVHDSTSKAAPTTNLKETAQTPPAKRRPRLIDNLRAQAENKRAASSGSSDDDNDGEDDESRIGGTSQSQSQSSQPAQEHRASHTSSPHPSQPSETPRPRAFVRHTSMTKKPGLKYTYSQQRTMLADDSILDGLDPLKADELAFSQPLLAPSEPQASAYDFDEGLMEDAAASGAVRGIHELRKAGANNRTTDEMNDILDRIGLPSAKASSVRRSALLEMATQIQDKTFRRQFLMHDNGTTSLLRGIGTETDPISGYLIAAILTTLLGTATSSHLSRQLLSEDVAKIMTFLLAYDKDITVISKDRKSNLSKFMQKTLAGVKSSVLQLKIWEPAKSPSHTSPRTLALMSMYQIQQQTPAGELFSADLTEKLFAILAAAVGDHQSKSWQFPGEPESMDLYLALSILVGHSPEAMESGAAVLWNDRHLHTVADILETSLSREVHQLGEIEILILQLTLNTANHNQTGQTIYLEKGLLRNLAQAAHTMFDAVLQSISTNTFAKTVVDTLTILLGLMINLAEHFELAGTTLKGFEPFDRLISFFHQYSSRTAEADSEEKATLNVAFGYLAVLLGCLCRHRPTRKRFEALNVGKGVGSLISAIQEFAKHLETTHSKFGVEGDPSAQSHFERLRLLIDELDGI